MCIQTQKSNFICSFEYCENFRDTLLTFEEHVYNKGELPDVQRGGAGADGLVQHPLQRGVPRRALHDARLHPHLLLRPHDHRQPPLLQVGAVTKRHACK